MTRFWLGVVAAVALVVAAFAFRHEVGPALRDLEAAVQGAGPLGPLLFVAGYSVYAVLCLPGPLILATAGTLFASHPAVAVASVMGGEVVAQAAAFLIARQVARDRVRDRVGEAPWFLWLEEQTRTRGASGVLAIRLMPFFPNSLANWAFGLTSIPFAPYLAASVVGSLPCVLAYILGTAGIVRLLRDRAWEHDLWLALGMLLAVVGVVLLLNRRRATSPAGPAD